MIRKLLNGHDVKLNDSGVWYYQVIRAYNIYLYKREMPAALTGQTISARMVPLDPHIVTSGGTERPLPTIWVMTVSVL